MARWVIGDIQGCSQALQKLLRKIQFDPSKDELYPLGDLINRGDDDDATIEWLFQHRHCVFPILGNHDLHFLAIYFQQRRPNRKDTFDTLLDSPHIREYCNWLIEQPLIRIIDEHFVLSHAGIPHIWSIKKALSLSEEVHEALISEDTRHQFFTNMYGNEPARWDDKLEGSERLRTITNYLTRMRYIDTKGSLELLTSGLKGPQKGKFKPWFKWRTRKNYTLMFGHWAALGGRYTAPKIESLDG